MAQSQPMQTFLPYADFAASAAVLDDRRLGKQRVETFQILRALVFPAYAWKNHPAVRMWRGFVPALVGYGLATCSEWQRRGFADTVAASMLEFTGGFPPDLGRLAVRGQLPPWLGLAPLHVSHRSALVRKEPEHYRRYFPDVPDDLPYLWPRAVFPRWPVRRPAGRAMSLAQALATLGFDEPRPGQAEAYTALSTGRDVLLAMPPGYGGSAVGLLVGLAGDGPTLWVSPSSGRGAPTDGPAPVAPPEGPPRPFRGPGTAAAEPTARAPGPADLVALAEEVSAAPDFVFLSPAALGEPATAAHLAQVRPGRTVVDDAAALSAHDAAAVATAVRELGSSPVLVVTGPTDGERRVELGRLLGLTGPVHAGGGFDRPTTWLGVRMVGRGAARARAAAELIAGATGPGLLLANGRQQADRLAGSLTRRGLRAGTISAGMRASRQATTLAAYRTGRLDVLVVADGTASELHRGVGRARVHFVHLAGPPADLDALHDMLGLASRRGEPAASVLLLTPDELAEITTPGLPGREALGRYAAGDGCRRALLLDHYGEPVAVPCGRCDRCAPGCGPTPLTASRG